MKKTKILIATAIVCIATFVAIAADHIDAPAVTGGTSDITDFYAFSGEDNSNIAFVANVQGLLLPGDTGSASFDENVLIEINIDTDEDAVQDLVIQAIPRDGRMYFFGPYATNSTDLSSSIGTTSSIQGVVDITQYGENAITATANNMTFFAGPRDDPFFFDFDQFNSILDPDNSASSFNDPGIDKFAGTNVLSVVVEVPKSMIGGSGNINTWVETKRKQ
ncbi:DUF4331 family protein [Winogradskyella bathintestinalis]|uniref:DUF4331 family protein n=1 Tax=Winogradskyella bathintestinalis TaxID=3035208 RepID=A0ABT7ZVH4_9FLAO|nr:DUF4331 family protein [Winogradskyella bathintestinalis]MDN3493010.1 DUF4331 family protein [Winogradskyella bathintestinalis]